jgi:hypothetical protein
MAKSKAMKLTPATINAVAAAVKANPRKFTKRSLAASLAEKLGGAGLVLAAIASLKGASKMATVRVAPKGKAPHWMLVATSAKA